MSKKAGGQAFPVSVGNYSWYEGMTLRDYFASKAINAILSDPDAGLLDDDLKRYAEISYRLADEMIRARDQ